MAAPRRVVIIGNGIAGTMVAAKLRAREPDESRLQIEIYSREPFEYYSRIRLPEIFASSLSAQDLEIYKPGWYEAKHIEVYKNQDVVKIDPASRRIVTRNGTAIPYDELVLCTGADSYKPPIQNVELDGVFTIREYGDADAIRRYLSSGTRNAVVVGGGLLGLEAARYLLVPGVDMVTIVEIMPRLLPRQLDQRGAQMLQRMIEGPRLSFRLGAEVHAFLGDRQVRGVRLADGGQLAAETVLVSAGISPRITLAREAGLRVRKGVIVDEYLRTSVEHIWAAGDIVEFQGIVWGIIPAAMDHAPVVAANLLGGEGESAPAAQRPESAPPAQRPESAPPAQRSESAPPAQRLVAYHQTIPQNTLKVAGVNVTSIGKVIFEKDEESRYQVIEKADEAKGRYEKYVMQNGILMGCILLGPRDNYGFATQRIGKPVTVEEIRIRLW